uniref:Basic leucine zipper ATF-like transcription factor 2 n=1 Tax=Poecilia latipinna TaxID=48699 RepID=A0A3B3U8E2_9TELE
MCADPDRVKVGPVGGETCPCCSWILGVSLAAPGNQPRPRVTKRREKNRDAARKSRRKQTERADELHEELQSLEQSNSALQKEIAKLKKDLRLYETALERHKPHCPQLFLLDLAFIECRDDVLIICWMNRLIIGRKKVLNRRV